MDAWRLMINGVDVNHTIEAHSKEYAQGAARAWILGHWSLEEIKPHPEEEPNDR